MLKYDIILFDQIAEEVRRRQERIQKWKWWKWFHNLITINITITYEMIDILQDALMLFGHVYASAYNIPVGFWIYCVEPIFNVHWLGVMSSACVCVCVYFIKIHYKRFFNTERVKYSIFILMIKCTKSKKVVSQSFESFEPFFSVSIFEDIWFNYKLRQLIAIQAHSDHIDGIFYNKIK